MYSCFGRGRKEQYFHLYEITARAIKEVDDKICVGGPAASGSKWVGSFMAYCKEREIPKVIFISAINTPEIDRGRRVDGRS